MGISFPNKARSFDDRKRCVRFTGYDGMFEIKFYLATEVLAHGEIVPKCHRGRLFDGVRCLAPKNSASGDLRLLQSSIQRDYVGSRAFSLSISWS